MSIRVGIAIIGQNWRGSGGLLAGLAGLAGLLSACSPTAPVRDPSSSAVNSPVATPAPPKPLEYQQQVLPHSIVHTLRVPVGSRYQVVAAVAEKVATVEEFARGYGAIAVINGGFFDPTNSKSTSPVIVQGKPLAVPENNERLMGNPDLLPYLDKILNRSEFRQYHCEQTSGQSITYAIALRQSLPAADCQIAYSLGAGPQLLPTLNLVQEGFLVQRNSSVLRNSLGSSQRNARSAVGLTQDGSVVWVMVAQKPVDSNNSGMTLPELADFLKTLKVETALNLDGGSSAAIYYGGRTYSGKVSESGIVVNRPVKSALLILSTQR